MTKFFRWMDSIVEISLKTLCTLSFVQVSIVCTTLYVIIKVLFNKDKYMIKYNDT